MKKASSELLLLDVNVLLALAWPNHQFHVSAIKRLGSSERWASCAVTQLGFIRLSSNPAVVSPARTPHEAASLLGEIVSDDGHVYLAQMPSPIETGGFEKIFGSGQVTDAYLVSLARLHRARLVTFDRRLQAVSGKESDVEILTG